MRHSHRGSRDIFLSPEATEGGRGILKAPPLRHQRKGEGTTKALIYRNINLEILCDILERKSGRKLRNADVSIGAQTTDATVFAIPESIA